MHGVPLPHMRRALAGLAGAARRGPAWRRRRLAASFALLGACAVVRGPATALLVVPAVLLILDGVLPMPGGTWSDADDRFRRLVRRRRRAATLRRLRGRAPERLELLDDQVGWAATAERRALGVRAVPVESITGTVEPLKARTFDGRLRPDRSAAEHWKRLWLAEVNGAALPPVSVYRVGEAHFLRDGHHRASVAREHGRAAIEADVVELHGPRR